MAGLEAKDVLLATALGGASGGGGGAGNYTTGTFTPKEGDTTVTFDTGYAGEGRLVVLSIYPVGGAAIKDGVTQQAWADAMGYMYVGSFSWVAGLETDKTYVKGLGALVYKASSTSKTTMNKYVDHNYGLDTTNVGTSSWNCVKKPSETQIVAAIPTEKTSDYGLAPGVEYRFHAIYSE